MALFQGIGKEVVQKGEVYIEGVSDDAAQSLLVESGRRRIDRYDGEEAFIHVFLVEYLEIRGREPGRSPLGLHLSVQGHPDSGGEDTFKPPPVEPDGPRHASPVRYQHSCQGEVSLHGAAVLKGHHSCDHRCRISRDERIKGGERAPVLVPTREEEEQVLRGQDVQIGQASFPRGADTLDVAHRIGEDGPGALHLGASSSPAVSVAL